MELKIEKQRVLEAAKAYPSSFPVLKTLFPEAFEPEDTLAIKKGVFNSVFDQNLEAFCVKAFGNEAAIRIASGAPYNLIPQREDIKHRSLYVSGSYDVELFKINEGRGGTIMVFKIL